MVGLGRLKAGAIWAVGRVLFVAASFVGVLTLLWPMLSLCGLRSGLLGGQVFGQGVADPGHGIEGADRDGDDSETVIIG